ncbi:hypothetical protein GCM10011495_06820 [Hymenobacter frigidus]|uniref:Uncharacterized protein n=1 Tax=Hymenobacter frigidus TaxID=1524095 RepID=A0ABQ1ZW80_9BACT|nr:hypothetical protein [Hymenobacter frigidus]GGH80903.1 hypothetical protein GCM10011495_06820 [Hymenobacter frigidus]
MSTTTYYRARCGSLYRVTHTPARAATKTSKATAASTIQARRSIYATEFSPAYPTTTEEVARLVAIGSFVQVPAP